jgi:hypothetical protein
MAVIWVVVPCSLVKIYQCLRVLALMVEAVSISKMLANFYWTTLHYNPEDSHLHTCCHENLGFY